MVACGVGRARERDSFFWEGEAENRLGPELFAPIPLLCQLSRITRSFFLNAGSVLTISICIVFDSVIYIYYT